MQNKYDPMKKIKTKFQPENVLIISLAHLLHDIYTSFLAPILPLLISKLNISIFQAGLLDISRKSPSFLNPLIGLLAGRTGVRLFVIVAPALTSIAMSLLGIASNYFILLILLFVTGISTSFFHVTGPVMIKYVSGNRLGKGMSFFMLGGELARTLGPLVILGAITLWTLEGTYRLIPFGILASIILYFRLRKIEIKKYLIKKQETGIKQTFRKYLPFFITISGIIFFRAAMKSTLTLYLPTYLTEKGHSIWFAGISLSILQLSGAAGTFLSGTISDRIGRKKALLIIAVMNPVLMWTFISFNGILLIPILIITGFFLLASTPVLLALVHDIDSRHITFLNGIYMTINFAVSSIMTLFVGFLADKIGLEITYKIAILLALGSIPFVFLMKGKKDKNE